MWKFHCFEKIAFTLVKKSKFSAYCILNQFAAQLIEWANRNIILSGWQL